MKHWHIYYTNGAIDEVEAEDAYGALDASRCGHEGYVVKLLVLLDEE